MTDKTDIAIHSRIIAETVLAAAGSNFNHYTPDTKSRILNDAFTALDRAIKKIRENENA